MPKIKNFGAGTPRLSEGIILSGSESSNYRALYASGTIEVSGRIHVSGEETSPPAPSDGAGGILYVKSDGKPYWISNEVNSSNIL